MIDTGGADMTGRDVKRSAAGWVGARVSSRGGVGAGDGLGADGPLRAASSFLYSVSWRLAMSWTVKDSSMRARPSVPIRLRSPSSSMSAAIASAYATGSSRDSIRHPPPGPISSTFPGRAGATTGTRIAIASKAM